MVIGDNERRESLIKADKAEIDDNEKSKEKTADAVFSVRRRGA
jgi:hypothetical protein